MGSADLSVAKILDGLGTRCMGRRVLLYRRVDSTNALARTLAAQGEQEGTLVLADEQTAGRGRLDRRWIAPAGTSLLLSLILRPPVQPEHAQVVTMLAALALRDAILACTGLTARLKWPNDLLLSGRKAGGILTELRVTGAELDYAVVGIGLNVNMPADALPPSFDATSLQQQLGAVVPRVPLLQELLRRIEGRYADLEQGRWPISEWAAALETIGQRVRVNCGTESHVGLAEAVDDSGALHLRLDNGCLLGLAAGDACPATHPDGPPTGGAR
jgi:BirA family biotin operon repressor/biotin-[acetyl-CoA-carboxylase] ligase